MPVAFDVFTVYHPCDTCADAIGRDVFAAIYRAKYEIARALQPESICEIGVRAGYSAAAFLAACPRARYLGIDNDGDEHGGVRGYAAYAREMLATRYARAWIDIRVLDSQSPSVRDLLVQHHAGAFDLVHVDGDHTEAGCHSDLDLALRLVRPGGAILVDDYDLIDSVRKAVDAFLLSDDGLCCQKTYRASPHGEMLIQRPQGPAMHGADCLKGGSGKWMRTVTRKKSRVPQKREPQENCLSLRERTPASRGAGRSIDPAALSRSERRHAFPRRDATQPRMARGACVAAPRLGGPLGPVPVAYATGYSLPPLRG